MIASLCSKIDLGNPVVIKPPLKPDLESSISPFALPELTAWQASDACSRRKLTTWLWRRTDRSRCDAGTPVLARRLTRLVGVESMCCSYRYSLLHDTIYHDAYHAISSSIASILDGSSTWTHRQHPYQPSRRSIRSSQANVCIKEHTHAAHQRFASDQRGTPGLGITGRGRTDGKDRYIDWEK
jgi:hypothetical protein